MRSLCVRFWLVPLLRVAPALRPSGATCSEMRPERVLHQAVRIENQRHGAVAQNGGPGNHLHMPVNLPRFLITVWWSPSTWSTTKP